MLGVKQCPSSAPHSSPLTVPVTWNEILLWVAIVFLIFGYELFHFSLSIDEEIHTFITGLQMAHTWLEQGRWGMSLLLLVFPPISALPMVSTAIGGAGLIVAAAHLVSYYRIDGLSRHVLAVSLITSPVWPHIVQFNPLFWGVGIGVALCAIGVRLLADSRWLMRLVGVGALALASGIYQVLTLVAVVMVLGKYIRPGGEELGQSPWPAAVRMISLVGASAGMYLGINYVAMWVTGAGMAYVDMYWRVSEYLADPIGAFLISLRASASWILGSHPIYLGYGLAFVVLPFLGILFAVAKMPRKERDTCLLRAFSLFGILAAVSLPVFVSVGWAPARSLVALPFMSAVLAVCIPLRSPLTQRAATAYLVVLVALSMWASATLFYSDHVMRERDRVVGEALLARLDNLRVPGEPMRFTLVGKLEPSVPHDPVRRVEVFGASFFEWDGGNVWRVYFYLRILGAHDLHPVDIAQLPEVASKSEGMPMWPAAGSVALIDGVAVIKLSPLTYEQRYRLGAMNPGHPLGLPR